MQIRPEKNFKDAPMHDEKKFIIIKKFFEEYIV